MTRLIGRTTTIVTALALLVAVSALAAAQDAGPPVAGDAGPAAPVAGPVAPVAPPLSPGALVDKSLHDAEHGHVQAAVKDDVKALRRGPLLIHGNYCGIGNRPGTPPTDPLDAACMHHDACTKTGGMPNCACDNRLRAEATAIAGDPSTPPNIQVLATAMAASMVVLICK